MKYIKEIVGTTVLVLVVMYLLPLRHQVFSDIVTTSSRNDDLEPPSNIISGYLKRLKTLPKTASFPAARVMSAARVHREARMMRREVYVREVYA